MKIAFILYDGMTSLDFVGVYDPLTRLKSMGFIPELEWELCSIKSSIIDSAGMVVTSLKIYPPLDGYDLVILPGGKGSREWMQDQNFLTWLRTLSPSQKVASVCTGSLLLAAAGLLAGKKATTHPAAYQELASLGVEVVKKRIVEDGNFITAGGVTAGIDLGLFLCRQLAGEDSMKAISKQLDYPLTEALPTRQERKSRISRITRETQIELELALDGSGIHDIATGVPFMDHMLSQISVHGLFDLILHARGDLEIDPHHTIEDAGLALGQAFREALGDRAGIVRMASAMCPMDESLAQVTVDFSGRAYSVVKIPWNGLSVGILPTSLLNHFFQSFASEARCNLHIQVFYGEDNHHQAEAVFKAFARALCAAIQIDPRKAGKVPSSKGKLF